MGVRIDDVSWREPRHVGMLAKRMSWHSNPDVLLSHLVGQFVTLSRRLLIGHRGRKPIFTVVIHLNTSSKRSQIRDWRWIIANFVERAGQSGRLP